MKPAIFWRVKWYAANGALVTTVDKLRAATKQSALDKARKIVRSNGREPNRLHPVAEKYEIKAPVQVDTVQDFWWMKD